MARNATPSKGIVVTDTRLIALARQDPRITASVNPQSLGF